VYVYVYVYVWDSAKDERGTYGGRRKQASKQAGRQHERERRQAIGRLIDTHHTPTQMHPHSYSPIPPFSRHPVRRPAANKDVQAKRKKRIAATHLGSHCAPISITYRHSVITHPAVSRSAVGLSARWLLLCVCLCASKRPHPAEYNTKKTHRLPQHTILHHTHRHAQDRPTDRSTDPSAYTQTHSTHQYEETPTIRGTETRSIECVWLCCICVCHQWWMVDG